jgi:hypothetical protein
MALPVREYPRCELEAAASPGQHIQPLKSKSAGYEPAASFREANIAVVVGDSREQPQFSNWAGTNRVH